MVGKTRFYCLAGGIMDGGGRGGKGGGSSQHHGQRKTRRARCILPQLCLCSQDRQAITEQRLPSRLFLSPGFLRLQGCGVDLP